MKVQTSLAAFELRDPSGFSIDSGAKTTGGRALSGKLHGYKKNGARDIITFTWPKLETDTAIALQTHIYEGRYQLIRLHSERFRGTVQYLNEALSYKEIARGISTVTLSFRIFKTEDFTLPIDYNASLPEHLK